MARTITGHADLDELLNALHLDTPAARIRMRDWPPVLIRMATHWFRHTQLQHGRIVLTSPTGIPWLPPRVERATRLIDSAVQFAVHGCCTVDALAELIAADPHRTAYYADAAMPPDMRLTIEFDTEPVTTDSDTTSVARMRITLPQHIPARHWPDDMEEGGQQHTTSFSYPQMADAAAAAWEIGAQP